MLDLELSQRTLVVDCTVGHRTAGHHDQLIYVVVLHAV
jgi:hypothetical protein